MSAAIESIQINTSDAAEILRCHPVSVGNHVKAGRLTPSQKGGRGRGGGSWFWKHEVLALRSQLEADRGQDLDLAGSGPLAKELMEHCERFDLNRQELTAMAYQTDPYRMDTVMGNRKGQWFKEMVDRFVPTGTVHIRGLHYRLIGQHIILWDGAPYINSDECYLALDAASDYGRWLGYVPFNRIVDNRNEDPGIFVPDDFEYGEPLRFVSCGDHIDCHYADVPQAFAHVGNRRQDYRICFIGEKSSLRDVLEPIARAVKGELILPTGNLSHTLIADLEMRAADVELESGEDGRPLIVLYFSDFDPSGYAMANHTARKLQALRTMRRHDYLEIRVYPVCLTKNQVMELGLPESPLKKGEKRKEKWIAAMGCEQVEIDALCALQPEILKSIAKDAVEPFYDFDLDDRIRRSEAEWRQIANAALREHPAYGFVNDQIELATEQYNNAVSQLNKAANSGRLLLEKVLDDLPEVDVPEPQYCEPASEPLYTTDDDFKTATLKLIDHRKYFEDLEAAA